MQNWPLFLALAAVTGMLFVDPSKGAGAAARGVSPMELSRLVNHEQAVLVDVRSKADFATGHIPKSRNVPLDDFEKKSKQLEKFKNRPLVLVCQHGKQSGKAAAQLRKKEFDKLFQLAGGLTEWQKDNLPLEKSKS